MLNKTRAMLLAALLASSAAQAADLRLGLHAESFSNIIGAGVSPVFGVDVSASGVLNDNLTLRGKLGAEWLLGAPALRLDATWLSRGELYWGAGLGSGVLFDFYDGGSGLPAIVFSPILLTNVHAVVGKNFGDMQFEGYLRAGVGYGAGISLNTLIR